MPLSLSMVPALFYGFLSSPLSAPHPTFSLSFSSPTATSNDLTTAIVDGNYTA